MDIYEPVIAEMQAQIEECQRVIITLEMMRSKGTGTPSSGQASVPTTQGASFSNDAFFGMTIAEGAKKFLGATKKTATAKMIADALVAGGFKTSAKNFVETVRSVVSRNQYFAFVNGEFGLADWYPGRKVTAKKPAFYGGGQIEADRSSDEVDGAIAQIASEPRQPS